MTPEDKEVIETTTPDTEAKDGAAVETTEGADENEDSEIEGEGQENEEGSESQENEEVEEVVEKPVGRAQARIQKLSSELKAEREDREKLIAERAVAQAQLENLRQQQLAVQSQRDRQAEEERLALLDPQERALYQANNQLRQLEHRLNQMEMQRSDDRDRANFHAKAAHDEMYAKYAEEVEQSYQDGLRRGVSAPREDLLAWRIGKELLQNKNSDGAKKKAAASKRIDTVTSKPASARGDVAGSKKGKSVEDRLNGVLI